MTLKSFLSVFLWIVFITNPTLASANTSNSTTLNISIIVPERAEDQKCVVGFENSLNQQFTSMKNSGCQYNSKKLLEVAYQQATKNTKENTKGFVTVIITAP